VVSAIAMLWTALMYLIVTALLLVVLVLSYTLVTRARQNRAFIQPNPDFVISPMTTIFAFDLHEVLMHPRVSSMLKKLFCSRDGLSFIAAFFRPRVFLFSVSRTLEMLYLNFFYKKGLVVEELFFVIAEKFPFLLKHVAFFNDVANDFCRDELTWNVIERLKAQGYEIYILSNIGERLFEDMCSRLMQPFYKDNIAGYFCCSQKDGYLKKPNTAFFSLFCERINHTSKRIIFVDDKVANLVAAQSSRNGNHFFGIRFHDSLTLKRDFERWKLI